MIYKFLFLICLTFNVVQPSFAQDQTESKTGKYADFFLENVIKNTEGALDKYLKACLFKELLIELDYPKLSIEEQIDFELLTHKIEGICEHYNLWGKESITPLEKSLPAANFALQLLLLSPKKPKEIAELIANKSLEIKTFTAKEQKFTARQIEILKKYSQYSQESAKQSQKVIEKKYDKFKDDFASSLEQLNSILKDLSDKLEKMTPDENAPPALKISAMDKCKFLLKYDYKIEHTPDELINIATSEYEKTLKEIKALCLKIDPKSDWKEIVKKSKDWKLDRNEYDKYAKELLVSAKDFVIKKDLVTVPKHAKNPDTQKPPHDARFSAFGWYNGKYVTAPFDFAADKTELEQRMRDNNRYWTAVVALHEGVPGHHLHLSIEKKLKRSELYRQSGTAVFTEGWGMYCEQMMFENGYLAGEPFYKLAQLRMRMWRCARILCDLGMQLGSISEIDAIKFLQSEVLLEPACSVTEVAQYSLRPGYFSCYLTGCLGFTKLRDECKIILGDKFSLKEFHDKILSIGNLPLSQLRKLLIDWADKKKGGNK